MTPSNGAIDRFRLDGRTALVTGARSGIGRACALALADAGADVVAWGRTTDGLEETAREVRDRGRHCLAVAADLADLAAVEAGAAQLLDRTRVDVLVNNGGTIHRSPALDVGTGDWDRVLTVNLDAAFVLCRTFGAPMLERGFGRVVNIASLLSFQGGINVAAYTASKHAVAGLTKALANEWAGRGVNVNAVAPGYIATANTEALRADPEREVQIRSRIPAGRWGRPEDVSGAVVFLASAAADYVHGHTLVVDGGWMGR